MSDTIENRTIKFVSYPENEANENNFKNEVTEYPGELKDGQLLLKLAYLSVDPYMRARMNPTKNYFEVFQVGEAITGGAICEIIQSKNSTFQKKQFVIGFLPWTLYQISDGNGLQALPEGIKPSYFLGQLGMPGISGYLPLFKIGFADKDQTIYISGAAGAVGSVAGQVCKSLGMTVIGSAGTKEKCEYLKEIGFDYIINYKTENVDDRLKSYAPEGLDIYFDNVGGETLDIAFTHMKIFGRIIGCGQISNYDTNNRQAINNSFMIITRRLRMEGFIITDWMAEWAQAQTELIRLFQEGKLKIRETVVDGFENTTKAFMGLFKGDNIGKMIVKI